MSFAKVYPLLVAKAEKKGRTQAEVNEVIEWLTGYTPAALQVAVADGRDYESFFAQAPAMNPLRSLITGKVCGVQVDTIQEPLMREIRYVDKLVDELAKGRPLEKILRKA